MTVLEHTRLLRSDNGPFWKRLRHELSSRGLNSAEVALAVSHEDDEFFEYGVIVTRDQKVFEFGFSYIEKPIEAGEIVEWIDMSSRWQSGWYHGRDVRAALEFLNAES